MKAVLICAPPQLITLHAKYMTRRCDYLLHNRNLDTSIFTNPQTCLFTILKKRPRQTHSPI
jgi:hypothetical protein